MEKSKVVAGLLGIFVGALGIHRLYLGKTGTGLLYLFASVLLCWTVVVPVVLGIVGFIEGVVYLCSSDEEFNAKYNG